MLYIQDYSVGRHQAEQPQPHATNARGALQGVPERSIRFSAARMLCTVNTRGHNAKKSCDKCSLIRSLQNSIYIFLMFNSY